MMDRPCHEDSTWYRAMTLTERIASARALQRRTLELELNTELAGRRMQRWRSQPQFTSGSHFAQRLRMAGLTEDDSCYLLGEPIEAVRDHFPDARWRTIRVGPPALAAGGRCCGRHLL